MLIVFIDIPRVIRNGLHPSRTKVSQASYIDGEVVFGGKVTRYIEQKNKKAKIVKTKNYY
jgi:hypothetical protein